ncbi:hypothetical protein IFR04_016070 [Cadophora malorum]|uniref:Protein kinase domain-containing protein n=1 Tax=Cadophora malorum TaxID=108018 RepID=A0A8H7SWK3_9HELO|nr:hypothetical protein IFR04_016070 [Cadophora malorum]
MADFTTTYREIDSETVYSGRRKDAPLVDGPASFLALVVKLGVPVLTRRQLGGGGVYSAGGGLSFSVSRTLTGITLRKGVDWANKVPHNWFDNVAVPSNDDEVVKIKGYIIKRIVLSRRQRDRDSSKGDEDVETFAATTTEIRILANKAVRQSRNIVALIGLSWTTREAFGRFLPEVLLEGATHGSLSQYLRVSMHRLSFRDKALILLDIVSGLGFLHENGIVHCDVKPSNILICDCSDRRSLGLLDMKPYIVKLCDFGCSIILSDYTETHQFQLKIGTPGWMAPEMKQGSPLDTQTLFKTDMYSLGHVAAVVAVGTRLPLEVAPKAPVDSNSASEHSDLDPTRIIDPVLSLLVDMGKGRDVNDLKESQLTLFSEIISHTLQFKPSDRADAADIYRLCKHHLLSEVREFHSEKDAEYLKSMLPRCPGKPLTTAFGADELFTVTVPELAALVLNGYVDDDGNIIEKVKSHLIKAIACGNDVAMSGAINVLQAMGQELPGDSQLRVLQRFQDLAFRAQGIAETKSLFFPLAFDTPRISKLPTGAACFPFVHRQAINEKLVGIRSWARECKQDFADYLTSRDYRHALYTVVLRILENHGIISSHPNRGPFFDSVVERYIYNPDVTFDILDPREQDIFVREVIGRDLLEKPVEFGLTLLQLSVCRGDFLIVRTLLEESLGADTNAYGKTPSWTPLWLACFLGYHDIATMLIQHGADITCQDLLQGITVLHLLSQFSSRDEVEGIGYQALAAGVDVNTGFVVGKEQQDNVTPLLASMLTFDFSGGEAAKFLLDNGASPLYFTTSYSEAYNLPVSPLSLCILNMDKALIESILSTDFLSWPKVSRISSVRVAQAVGAQLMRTKTCFRAMLETGKNYNNLQSILQEVVGWVESRIFYWKPDWSPIGFAYDIDRVDIMKLLLKIDRGTSLDIEDAGASMNILEQCVIRHNFRCVKALVRHGADVLGSTRMKDDALSLVFGGDQMDTAGIFDTLIVTGGSEELVIAEALRVKYHLSHDRVQPFPPNCTTLMGALLVWSNAYGYGRLDQVRYLLSLRPKPKFQLPSGVNLFQLALMITDGTDAAEQIELIRLLLNAYPDMENLTRGLRHMLPPLLQAATGTNLEVIRLLEDHVRTMHPGKTLPYNYLHHRAESTDGSPAMMTMLDACSLAIQDRGLVDINYGYGPRQQGDRKRKGDIKLSLVDQLTRHKDRKEIFTYLREKGAQFWYEIDGYFIGARIELMTSVSTRNLYAFLQKTTMKYSLGPWIHKVAEDDMALLAWFPGTSSLAAQYQLFRVLELMWSENSLRLCASDFAFPSADASRQINRYLSTRVEQKKGWGRTYGENPPYTSTNCLEPWIVKQDEDKGVDFVKYIRPGRIWTSDEVEELTYSVFREWDEEFGERDRAMISELQAAVMSYF